MELLLALGDEVDDAAHAFGFVLGRGVGDDLYAADLRGGHALDHILEIVAHRCRIAPVEQYLVIALSVEQDVAVAVERELRNLADDLVERARRSLRVVLDRVGGLLGVGHYERFLDFDHHVADLDTLRDGDLAERLARCGHFHGLFVGRVAYHRDAELVVARFGGFEREAAVRIGGYGVHDRDRVALERDGGIADGFAGSRIGDRPGQGVGLLRGSRMQTQQHGCRQQESEGFLHVRTL